MHSIELKGCTCDEKLGLIFTAFSNFGLLITLYIRPATNNLKLMVQVCFVFTCAFHKPKLHQSFDNRETRTVYVDIMTRSSTRSFMR
jgi:hypothetical protein